MVFSKKRVSLSHRYKLLKVEILQGHKMPAIAVFSYINLFYLS